MRGGTFGAVLDSNTTVLPAAIRGLIIASPPILYDYFDVRASWTGGTGVSITVNATVVNP
jgi:hypothetical protein